MERLGNFPVEMSTAEQIVWVWSPAAMTELDMRRQRLQVISGLCSKQRLKHGHPRRTYVDGEHRKESGVSHAGRVTEASLGDFACSETEK